MKRVLIISVLALSVMACDRPDTSVPAPAAEPRNSELPTPTLVNATKATEPNSTVVAGPGESIALPQGIIFDFPYTLRVERSATSRKGELRRWIGLEYTTGDQRTALTAIRAGMTSAGFTAHEQKPSAHDGLRQEFLKRGYGRVLITVLGSEGQKLTNPEAKGVVWLDLPAE